jgi:chromosome segregation ATPase
MKNLFIATLVTTIATLAVAEPYQVQQGLDKIKTNFENSKANKSEYDKNLNIVNGNITEISKAKAAVIKQKNDVSTEIVKNNESLKKVLVQEKEIQAYIKSEEDKVAAESKQVEQLEGLIAQIKKNQEQRSAIIANYQEQLRTASEEKVAWKSREGELRTQEGETIKVIRGVASEEVSWMNRKKGYEIEVKRWSAEAEKQQKIFDTYQGLKEEK